MTKDRHYLAASFLVDSILHDLGFLHNKMNGAFGFLKVKRDLSFLKTFLLWSRMWRNKDVYVESYYLGELYFPSFCSIIGYTLYRYGNQIQSFCSSTSSSERFPIHDSVLHVVSEFEKSIINICIKDFRSLGFQSSSCCIIMSDDELVDFLDSVLQNLAWLLKMDGHVVKRDFVAAFHPHVDALEDKITTLKNFMGFAKFFRVEVENLEHLLTHIQFVAMNAARLSYLYYVGSHRDFEVKRETLSTMSKSLEKGNADDLQIYETYIKVLAASLQTTKMDKHILRNFNDSLITCLWELLLCKTSFMVSVKGQIRIIFEGLRFLRSILLRKRQEEQMGDQHQLDGKIVTILREAGIAICSLYLNEANKVDDVGSSSVVRDSLPHDCCCAMLVNIDRDIQLIKSQIADSSMIEEGLPSYQIYKEEEFDEILSLKTSKGRVRTTREVVVELKDEAEKVIDRVVRGSENLEIIPIVGMPGLGKTTLAKNVYNSPSIVHRFHIRLWCSVSQVYDTKGLLLQMLLDDGKYFTENEEDLLQKLYQKLKGNRYLVVFDDVWDIGVWNDLKFSFPNDNNGSRIIFHKSIF
ncbi:hypothetical protein ACH5RR_028302 [Cinchona calisaya]|uniref:Uncharacterized protein n=1 Tax=Cinchona calisaya TaxID=153742 RepID=A0ABD2YQK7_9GENT